MGGTYTKLLIKECITSTPIKLENRQVPCCRFRVDVPDSVFIRRGPLPVGRNGRHPQITFIFINSDFNI